MAENYLIYTDASADVDLSRLAEGALTFVPMRYMVGEEERICSTLESEETLKKFYQAQREGKSTRTSQITPNAYREAFEPVVKEGTSVLYLCLSSGLTKTYDSVCLAASELAEDYSEAKVVAVDTLSATAGMGIMIERAVANREKGMSIEENAEDLRNCAKQTVHWFMVDDLMYLKRGGRLSATAAVLGSALNLKPVLMVDEEGKLVTVEKKRGHKVALKCILEKYREHKNGLYGNRVYIVHGDAPELADEMEKLILKENPDADISKVMLCPVIGSHTGPGMIAAVFGGDRNAKP